MAKKIESNGAQSSSDTDNYRLLIVFIIPFGINRNFIICKELPDL